MYDVCIVGAGASGMCAAIVAKEKNPELNILVLEKKEEPGKKILASGNGKCNLSNVKCENYRQTLSFFQQLGVITRTDGEGRIYPYTEDASVVRDCLTKRLNMLGIKLLTGTAVENIIFRDNFIITAMNRQFIAEKVLIACGGKVGPAFGTTGDAYNWIKSLGHNVKKPIPVLTAVQVKEDISSLAGIRVKGKIGLKYNGDTIFEEMGEIQFNRTDISGICVFNLSRFLIIPEGKKVKNGFDDYKIFIDFFPTDTNLEKELIDREKIPGLGKDDIMLSMVRKPISDLILKKAGSSIEKIAYLLHNFNLSPGGVKGWDYAQATKGGVALEEIDPDTMESKKVSNLFFAGEVTDFDGPCGGFNLQNAWETGIKAGKGISNV